MQTNIDLNYCAHCGDLITKEPQRLNGFSEFVFHKRCRDFLFIKEILYDFQYKKTLIYTDEQFKKLNSKEHVLYFESKGIDLNHEKYMYKDSKDGREMSILTLLNLKNKLEI